MDQDLKLVNGLVGSAKTANSTPYYTAFDELLIIHASILNTLS